MNALRPSRLKCFQLWATVELIFLSGCVAPHRQLPLSQTLNTEVGSIHLLLDERNSHEKAQIEIAVRAALPRLKLWGTLPTPVRLFVLPTHAALEDAVGKKKLAWLRAWARYDEVFLQSPRTWALWGARQQDINELVLHELSHCVMYQMSASSSDWRGKGIPFWFKEGMASWTAEQGFRWPRLEQLAQEFLALSVDPLTQPEALTQKQSTLAYGAAHHAFVFLQQRYGLHRIQELLALMKSGDSFEGAFRKSMGLSVATFLQDFRRYVALRGFRSGRLRAP